LYNYTHGKLKNQVSFIAVGDGEKKFVARFCYAQQKMSYRLGMIFQHPLLTVTAPPVIKMVLKKMPCWQPE